MTEDPGGARGRPFREGERILLVDRKGRRYLLRLRTGRTFQSHAGIVAHDLLIGAAEGSEVEASLGGDGRRSSARYLALRPTLADVVVGMPRGAQVIYPKDLGAIVIGADIFPGARVLEAGVGSGALSLALLRAGADVVGYEVRPDFADQAMANVAAFLGSAASGHYEVVEHDIYEGIEVGSIDRILLDLPEPWRVVEHAERALVPGGILCAYLPSINQTAELRRQLHGSRFGLAETFEVLRRTWHIEGRSVRPDQRMVAHTGFITTARLLGPSGASRQPASDAAPEPAHDSGSESAADATLAPGRDAGDEPAGDARRPPLADRPWR